MFSKSNEYVDQTFEAIDAREALVEGKEFDGCRFKGAQLAGAVFRHCRFLDCVFEDSDLSNVRLTSSSLRDVSFLDSKLLGINWTEASHFDTPSFTRCVLNYANFANLDLRKGRFVECIAREVEWTQAQLAGASFKGSDLAGSRFHQSNLTKADFREAFNYVINPIDNKLKGARFSLPEATSLLHGLGIILDD